MSNPSNPSKPVAQLKDKKIVHIYNSAYAAAKHTGLSYSHIQDTCHNRRCGVGGYKWRYATKQEINDIGLYKEITEST